MRRRPAHEKLATACTETGPRRTSSPPLTGRVIACTQALLRRDGSCRYLTGTSGRKVCLSPKREGQPSGPNRLAVSDPKQH